MTKFRADAQFSYNDTLLQEGKYREWFWEGLHDRSVEFLNAPVKVPTPPPAEPIFKNQEFPQVKRWREKAVCKDADPVVFFGVEGADLKREYLKPDAEWRQFCPQCPVRDLCLELARNSESEGIFGGKLFQFYQAWKNNKQESRKRLHEYDDETMPRKGRPRGTKNKPKNFMRVAADKRQLLWQEKQKEINDRISAAVARESLSDQ